MGVTANAPRESSWLVASSLAQRIGSLALFIAVWQIAAGLIDSRLLPSAGAVFLALGHECLHGALLFNLGITLARVAAAFAIAMVVGTAIGIVMGRSRAIDVLFDSWLVLLLNLPALVIIVLAYVWFGLTEAAAIGAVAVNKIPALAVTLREGARALDRNVADMAASFHVGRWRTFRHVIMPQLYPYLFGAARSGLALVWKIVLIVELLGQSNGVGFQIQLYFQQFDVTRHPRLHHRLRGGDPTDRVGGVPAAGEARRAMAPVTPALAANIREKRYPRVRGAQSHVALAGLSLEVAPGEFVALVGPSGCGKTTFLNIVAGLDRDFDGEARLAPRPDGGPARVGYVFQEPRLLPWRTVHENIALVLPPHGADAIVGELLAAVGLAAARDLYPPQLSGGMSRRVAIARAFAIQPDLLLMDEPFVSLDHDTVEQLRELLLKLWHARPTTVLFVTHDLREALVLADRLVLLSATPGHVVADVPVRLARNRRDSSAEIEPLREEILRHHRELIGAAGAPTPVE